jgi:hypothetical protein
MTFQPHLLRAGTLLLMSLILIVAASSLHPVGARYLAVRAATEQYVLGRVRAGDTADLKDYSKQLVSVNGQVDDLEKHRQERLQLSGEFIAKLLSDPGMKVQIPSQEIRISNAVIIGGVFLNSQEIPYDLRLEGCTFEGPVDLHGVHFAQGLDLSGSTFTDSVDFSGVTIGLDLVLERSTFESTEANFQEMRVGHAVKIESSEFKSVDTTSFKGTVVGGAFTAHSNLFSSHDVSFADLRVGGEFAAKTCAFGFDELAYKTLRPLGHTEGTLVSFAGAHFADAYLDDSVFNKVSTIDFSKMQADFISFAGVIMNTPSDIKLERITFKTLSPVNADSVKFLFSHYNPEFYTNLEASWRTHGYSGEADKIYVAKRRAERRENCKSFLHQCGQESWAWSMFQDALSGYGRHLENLLYWSLGFLLVGAFVFRTERGMRIKDEKDAPHYVGRYNAVWYSLDLFLPIIKLGEADVWTPKDNRRWANLYRRVHIIIGSLFVPIGLAAWTGIIK